MIIKENERIVEILTEENLIEHEGEKFRFEDAIFFDLEHYVYKKPKCVGVFGAAIFEPLTSKMMVTQYMIENKNEVKDILTLAKRYFETMKREKGKKYIVTFSGNNDFTVINYLFNRFGFNFVVQENFDSVDLQKEYENKFKMGIGLKALEKMFDIEREGEVISGSNLAKTFHKVLKDDDYIQRMPKEKVEKILIYNEMDVVNLFHICMNWHKYARPKFEERDNNITGVV